MNKQILSKLFTRAWGLARRAVTRFGGKVSEFFAESLRTIWQEMKLGPDSKVTIRVMLENRTDKAILVNLEQPKGTWIPQSIIQWESDMATTGYYTGHVLVTMPVWKFRELLRSFPWMCQFLTD